MNKLNVMSSIKEVQVILTLPLFDLTAGGIRTLGEAVSSSVHYISMSGGSKPVALNLSVNVTDKIVPNLHSKISEGGCFVSGHGNINIIRSVCMVGGIKTELINIFAYIDEPEFPGSTILRRSIISGIPNYGLLRLEYPYKTLENGQLDSLRRVL